jgi:hypothetical protein
MSLPTHKCHKCHDFMKVEKINGDYVLLCPTCDEKKNKEEE